MKIGDPVPVEKAFASGCDRVVVLVTKPENVLRTSFGIALRCWIWELQK